MWQNYFKVAWRNLWRYKGFSLINIVSLSLGISFALLIGLWVKNELSYDRFHDNLDDLYFVWTNADWDGLQTWPTSPGPLATSLKAKVPEIKAAARHAWENESLLKVGEKAIKFKGLYTDPDFLQMFSFEAIEGDLKTALSDPNSIVITESLANTLFGLASPIGQQIQMEENENYTVSAVLKDVSLHSTIQFTWLGSWDRWAKERNWVKTWGNVTFSTYVQLQEGADPTSLAEKLNQFEQAKEHGLEFFLQPLAQKYLYSKFEKGVQNGGRIDYVNIFSLVAIFLLVIACINFMNLATARSGRRAKEIGIRKTVGAARKSLTVQFISEAILLAFISSLLAIVLVKYSLGSFNKIFDKSLTLDFSDPFLWISILGLSIITGFLAGSYPAFLLSSFKPVQVLKGGIFQMGDQSSLLRKALVIFQFAISVFLIISTIVVHRQLSYIKNKNLGIDRKDLIYLNLEGDLYNKRNTLREKLQNSPFIKSVTFTQSNPMNLSGSSGDLEWPGKDPEEMLLASAMAVGEGFTKTFGVELIAGRDFSSARPGDTSNYIVNEELVKSIGLDDPIGTEVEFWFGKGQIVGVMKNYHLQSMHIPIKPLILGYYPENASLGWIKPNPGQTKEAIRVTRQIAQEINPDYPFQYNFADESFNQIYQDETLIAQLANIFGIIAILVSCLGLFGLSTYSAERRRKEIGIRKVFGATVQHIVQLLSTDFLKLVLVSILLAVPFAWYFSNEWLQTFAYSIQLEWWYFVIAGFSAVLIAFFTISFQSIKAAISNPVNSIRSE